MGRPLWKGSLSFGLVNIPIELHVAVKEHRPRFRLLHASDRSPIRLDRVCLREGQRVAWDDLVKGYEYEKGRFVVLTREDFRAAAVEKTRTVDILDFVVGSEIDDRFFETPYYVVPAKGGEHGYALLREAMRTSGRVGIAMFILHDAQRLAALEVTGHALVLILMRYADELVNVAGLQVPGAKGLRAAELDMARKLVENLTSRWSPGKYADQYRNNLRRIIQAKRKGRPPALEPLGEPRRPEVTDLMERLRRSLTAPGRPRPSHPNRAGRGRSAGRGGGAGERLPEPHARRARKHRAA